MQTSDVWTSHSRAQVGCSNTISNNYSLVARTTNTQKYIPYPFRHGFQVNMVVHMSRLWYHTEQPWELTQKGKDVI